MKHLALGFFITQIGFTISKLFRHVLTVFQKRDFGQLANFGERCGKMSYRLRLACLIAV